MQFFSILSLRLNEISHVIKLEQKLVPSRRNLSIGRIEKFRILNPLDKVYSYEMTSTHLSNYFSVHMPYCPWRATWTASYKPSFPNQSRSVYSSTGVCMRLSYSDITTVYICVSLGLKIFNLSKFGGSVRPRSEISDF
jgi:hypothetical protein